jgi:signal transduction protein with GAF and PtsI domain
MTPGLRVEIQKVLDRQGTSDLAFDSIACKLLGEFDARSAVVYTPDAATGMLKLRCHCGLDRVSADKIRFLCVGKGLSGKAASLREPVQGWQYPEALCPEEREVLPEGTLYVPMITGNAVRGVLGIAKEFRREYAPDEIAALAAVARLIAPYLK